MSIEIAVLGERDAGKRAHQGIEASAHLAGNQAGGGVVIRWIPTINVTEASVASLLSSASGVWCAPGSPYASLAGALRGIRWARETGRPFFGTCGGFQHALMEVAETVLGRFAAHAELDPAAPQPLIQKLSCSLVEQRARILFSPGSWFAQTVGSADAWEEFHCRYGLAPEFETTLAAAGFAFDVRDESGQVRGFKLRGHPHFVGTLFQPERAAISGKLHPLVRSFFEAAARPTLQTGGTG